MKPRHGVALARCSAASAVAISTVLAAALSGCTVASRNPLCAACDRFVRDDCVVFHVVSPVPDGPDKAIEGAQVFVTAPRDLLWLGQTPASGDFVVPRPALLTQGAPAMLVFCWDHLSLACTGVRLDLPNIGHWDEFNVTLPANPLSSPRQAVPAQLVLPVTAP